VCVLGTPVLARAGDTVLHWNEISVSTAIAGGQNNFAQSRTNAIVSLAVFEAVNTITRDYEPYLGTFEAPDGASVDAAAAAAAWTVLREYFKANASIVASLDTALAESLSAIPNGQSKDDGKQLGIDVGKAFIGLRSNDGSSPAAFKAPGPAVPGEWQATPSCPVVNGVASGINYQWRHVAPFGVRSVNDFLPPPPPGLTSSQYAKDFAEVASVGLDTSVMRPADRADVARFYAGSGSNFLLDLATRQVAEAKGESLSANARSLALVNMSIADALVASFNAKYTYNLWRPETAIRGADTDANGRTDANPAYKPYIVTPCFPSYPSNHASGSGAGAEALRRLYGADGHSIDLANPAIPGLSFHYSGFHEITKDVDDARVYAGIHFRFDQDAGGTLGRDVATYVIKNNLRPIHP
jgi:membrane-associated phospholipid phosphatase